MDMMRGSQNADGTKENIFRAKLYALVLHSRKVPHPISISVRDFSAPAASPNLCCQSAVPLVCLNL
jgi:hypothetical protein